MKCLVIGLLCSLALSAQNRTDLENRRKILLKEIENTQQLLNDNNRSLQSGLNRLSLVAKQIKDRQTLLQTLQQELDGLNAELSAKQSKINALEKDLQGKKKDYATAIRQLYKQQNSQDELLFVFSGADLSQAFRRMLYIKEYSGWRRRQAEEIATQQRQITIEKQELMKQKADKEVLAGIKKREEEKLHAEETTRKQEVAGLQKNKKKLQSELNKKQQQAASLNREIERIIREEIRKSEKSAAKPTSKGKKKTDTTSAAPPEQRKAETQGGFMMTKEEQNLSSSFSGNKGRLPFPLKGNYRIVTHFGQQQYGGMENVRFNSNGIEIRTTAGNSARAVFDGVVTRVFVVPGFQKSVIIRHGNYLTLYSYLEDVFVKEGARVKTGQEIGKIYTDKEKGNETVLYFEMRKEQTKLNPEVWLNN